VIDTLDESGAAKTRSDLLHILSGTLQNSGIPQITDLPQNFRFIVTSRPLRDIQNAFADAQHIRRISMDDIPPDVAEHDIYAYMSKKLARLSHFGREEFIALAKKADGLFEWARLACESIEAPPLGLSSNQSFNVMVSRDPVEREHLLYDMYDFILTEIMRKDKHANHQFQQTQLASFRSVMGQILGTVEPLPLNSLNAMRSHFLDENERYAVEVIVEHMGSLLNGTTDSSTPIRPLHASFLDFLTDQSHSGEFFVDVSNVQHNLAFASLRVMECGLSFNMCDLKSSYLPNSEDSRLRERVEKCISPHLSYACRFWPIHIQPTHFDPELATEIKSFFEHERLFFWFEVLGLMNALSGAVPALALIGKWLKVSTWLSSIRLQAHSYAQLQWQGQSGFEDASSAAMDVQRFIQVFGSIILHSTPHLYVSALPFSPVNCALSRMFSARFPNTLRVASGRDTNWTAVQTVITGHTDAVKSLSFSPDGTRIATGSTDRTVRLWDAATGQPVGKPLLGHTSWVSSVSFSPDGMRIVSGSGDMTVRLWDVATWQPIGEPLLGHTGTISSVAFSSNGSRIVTGSEDKTVRLWNAAMQQPIGEPLRGHTDEVNSVSFSPDDTRIVSGSDDKAVRLWEVATGQPAGEPLEGHTFFVLSVSFSPDGTRIASGSRHETVRLWDAATGKPVCGPLKGHTRSVESVSFSPDGSRIVTGSDDQTVRLWDAVTGKPVGEPLLGHTGSVYSISFSPDGTRIAIGSQDKTVRLWNVATGQPVGEPLRGHTDSIISVSFSSDGTRIISCSYDGTVRVWYVAIGKPLQNYADEDCSASSPLNNCLPHSTAVIPTPNTANDNFISFSSNSTHALRDTVELLAGAAHDDRRSTFAFLGEDGWMMGPNGQLLFWVPPASREVFRYSPWTALVLPSGSPELDLSRMAHGTRWQHCYEK
jgi:WD40 repeat protein